jgi:signal transduction histidine kinase
MMLQIPLPDVLSPSDTARLAALAKTGLLDSPPEERFDQLTRLASRLLGAPMALLSLVDARRSFFKSSAGFPEEARAAGQVPLSHSICRHVVRTKAPLLVGDARADAMLMDEGAVKDFGVVAYAGVPIVDGGGHALGAFCVIDMAPREWTERDLAIIGTLAACAAAEIGRTESVVVARDARERAEEDKLAALSRLCATVAHDFNNVLAGVAGYADLLQGDPSLDATARADVDEIIKATDRGRVLSSELTTAGRTAAPVRASVDVNDVVTTVAAAADAAAPEAGRIAVVLGSGIPPVVADRAQLAEALHQLVENARWAVSEGGTVTIRTSAEEGGAIVAVEDTGIGMTAELQRQIFEPFLTTRRTYGRRGLGLTTGRALVTRMGGRVKVESAVGVGSVFRVTLPLATDA